MANPTEAPTAPCRETSHMMNEILTIRATILETKFKSINRRTLNTACQRVSIAEGKSPKDINSNKRIESTSTNSNRKDDGAKAKAASEIKNKE